MELKTKILLVVGGVTAVVAVGYLTYKVIEAVKELKEEARLEAEQKALESESEDYGDEESVDSPESHSKPAESDLDKHIEQMVEEGRRDWERRMEKLAENRALARRGADINIMDATDAVYSGEMDDVESFYEHEERMNELYPDMGDIEWEGDRRASDSLDLIEESVDMLEYSDEIPTDESDSYGWEVEEEERGGFTPEESEMYRESGFVMEHDGYTDMSDEDLLDGEINRDAIFIPYIKNDPDSPEGWREIKDVFMENIYDMNNRVMIDKLFSYEWKKPIPVHKEDVDIWWINKRNITMKLGADAKHAQTVSVGQMLVYYATKMTMHMEAVTHEDYVKNIDDYVSHLLGQIGLSEWPDNPFAVDLIVAKLSGHTLDPMDNGVREWGMFGVDLAGEDLSVYEFGIPFSDQFKMFLEQYGAEIQAY